MIFKKVQKHLHTHTYLPFIICTFMYVFYKYPVDNHATSSPQYIEILVFMIIRGLLSD